MTLCLRETRHHLRDDLKTEVGCVPMTLCLRETRHTSSSSISSTMSSSADDLVSQGDEARVWGILEVAYHPECR